MKKKVFLISVVIVAFCFVGAGLIYAAQKPTAVIPYEKTLSQISSPYTEAELAESGSAYLQKADFAVTADNFYQSFYDFLAAPVRLYYADDLSIWHKCDAMEINVKFANAFKDLPVHEIEAGDFNGIKDEGCYGKYYFRNELGHIDIFFNIEERTYFSFQRGDDMIDYFYVDGNLFEAVKLSEYEVLDYSMEAKKSEVE